MTESSKVRFYNQLKKDLSLYLTERVSNESVIEDIKTNERAFINELNKVNLFGTYGNEKCFDDSKSYSLSRRFSKIYNIKDAILGIIGQDSMEPGELCNLILVYVSSFDGYDNLKFYDYLTENNYVNKANDYEKITISKKDESFLGSLVDILDAISTGNNVASHKESGKYNLVDVRDDMGRHFSGGNGKWTYKDDDYKVKFEVSSMPKHLSPGDWENIKLYIDKVRDDITSFDDNLDFKMELRSRDFRFNRNKLSLYGSKDDAKDTIRMTCPSGRPSDGHRVYIDVVAKAGRHEARTTYVYEYYKK